VVWENFAELKSPDPSTISCSTITLD